MWKVWGWDGLKPPERRIWRPADEIRKGLTMARKKYETDAERLEARRDQKRQWARDHADAIRENLRKWRSENPERAKELQAENWAKNGENYNARRRKANKDKA